MRQDIAALEIKLLELGFKLTVVVNYRSGGTLYSYEKDHVVIDINEGVLSKSA